MNRKIKIVILIICLLAAVGADIYLYMHNLYTYLIVAGAVTLLITIGLILYVINTRNDKVIYANNLKKILNYYDAVLVESHNFPNLKDKNIIRVTNMEDLIDAQIEIRKPIYYMIEGEDSCSFVLIDNNEVCVFILKQNESVESPLELILNEYDRNNDIDKSLLEDIERTTIIKLNNMKSYKVSPYKKEKKNKSEQQGMEKQDEKLSTIDDDKAIEKTNEIENSEENIIEKTNEIEKSEENVETI